MEAVINSIMKAQNAHLLELISTEYGLNIDDLRAKYLRPSFYLLDVKKENVAVEYTELKARRATKQKQKDGSGEALPEPSKQDS